MRQAEFLTARRQEISIMYLLVMDDFAKTVETLSAGAILNVLELESKLLEFDPENYRLYLPADAYSIFCFRQFVRSVKLGKTTSRCKPLPPEHVKFYRQTVTRLIEANELPQSARQQFDNTFSIARKSVGENHSR